jgi:hypothetical protein
LNGGDDDMGNGIDAVDGGDGLGQSGEGGDLDPREDSAVRVRRGYSTFRDTSQHV